MEKKRDKLRLLREKLQTLQKTGAESSTQVDAERKAEDSFLQRCEAKVVGKSETARTREVEEEGSVTGLRFDQRPHVDVAPAVYESYNKTTQTLPVPGLFGQREAEGETESEHAQLQQSQDDGADKDVAVSTTCSLPCPLAYERVPAHEKRLSEHEAEELLQSVSFQTFFSKASKRMQRLLDADDDADVEALSATDVSVNVANDVVQLCSTGVYKNPTSGGGGVVDVDWSPTVGNPGSGDSLF